MAVDRKEKILVAALAGMGQDAMRLAGRVLSDQGATELIVVEPYAQDKIIDYNMSPTFPVNVSSLGLDYPHPDHKDRKVDKKRKAKDRIKRKVAKVAKRVNQRKR